jgi:hypothetical protein
MSLSVGERRWWVAFTPSFPVCIMILHFKVSCTMSSPWISNLEASLRSDFYSLQTAKCLMALVTETRLCCITSCNATCCNYTCPSFILVLKMQNGKIQSMKYIIYTCVLCDFTYLIDLDFSSMDCKSYSCAGSLIASTAMHTIISDFWRFKSQEYSTVSAGKSH